jgi:ABC-2 type transport system ATP-binding protein
MKKRLDLATALIHRPRILFLDEPTTGLDPQNRAGLWRYLEKLNKEEKLTIFLTTHYMEEADRLCDRLAIIDGGKIIAEDNPTALKAGMGGDVISLNFKGNGVSAQDLAAKAKNILDGEEFVRSLRLGEGENSGNLSLIVQNGGEVIPQVLRTLDAKGLRVASLNLTSPTLDDVFLKFTGQRIRQDDPVKYSGRAPWMNRKKPSH